MANSAEGVPPLPPSPVPVEAPPVPDTLVEASPPLPPSPVEAPVPAVVLVAGSPAPVEVVVDELLEEVGLPPLDVELGLPPVVLDAALVGSSSPSPLEQFSKANGRPARTRH